MKATYAVEGMSCQGCVRSVMNALAQLDPDLDVAVSLEEGTVTVDGDVDGEAIKTAVENAGYDFVGAAG